MPHSNESPARVVITGMGVISPLGNSPKALWEGLRTGRSGVTPHEPVPTDSLPTRYAARATEFTGGIDDFGPLEKDQTKAIRKGLKIMCRESQMGVAAATHAMADAALDPKHFDPERVGVVYGSDYMLSEPQEFSAGMALCSENRDDVEFARWGTDGMQQMSPLWLLKYLPNMPACHIAIYNDLRGPNNSLTLREAAANLAVGEAFRTIARRAADVMIAGATGTRVHAMKAVHSLQQEEVAQNGVEPSRASRPFDLNRSGMVLGEGAGAVVLEELSHAQARGATIYGEVVGFASSSVADRNLIAKRDVALINAILGTLRDAGIKPDQVGHVHAHGLSTRSCDIDESTAIHNVFGERTKTLPVIAAKSYFGNLGAGSGVVELVASVLALNNNSLFPILNYENPDPDCPVAAVTQSDVEPGDCFINLSVTPQGQASCVMVRRFA